MKYIYLLYLTTICSIFLFFNQANAYRNCYPEGCFEGDSGRVGNWSSTLATYQEAYEKILDYYLTKLGKTREEIAGLTGEVIKGKYKGTFINGVLFGTSCNNGSNWSFTQTSCSNGATNPSVCNICPNGSVMQNNVCSCPNGANNPPSCNICPSGTVMTNGQCICTNGSTNAPSCNICPSGLAMENNLCGCANGATNPTQCNICPSGSNMVNNQCTCTNGGTATSNCSQCPSGQVMHNSQCVTGCDLTNACGQTAQGVMINGACSMPDGSNANNSCITTFNVSGNSVNPNGSVEFVWSLATLPNNVRQNCGFVDLTTPTARPIPGLQNLDPTIDRARITNIQTTTRFCLICQFFNTTTNANLGEAIAHQWIRVIRVGEN